MATALAAQLATIAAKSTNQLDLKAQRRAHSQSLIFEPGDAAVQDFDTLYELCVEGFRELCLLDARFRSFAKSIFSEHSKSQERTQMTTDQNKELDVVLERFLHLVGSKVLLQPAIKAIEWLVRRFRVHEYNTLCLILTFLPYHTLPVFATLLSIVPKRLSPATKFLHPYVQSLASPPRHVVAYAATNNIAFFTSWNNYVIKSCQERYYSQVMVSYWATVMTEAVAGQLDQTASGRREAQRQKEEDVLLRVLPVLSKGLAMKLVPDARVGCYMILSVLASKANLDDKVLLDLVEAVASGGRKETFHAELICIAVLIQRRTATDLPTSIFQRLISTEALVEDLVLLSERYKVGSLAFSLSLGIVERLASGEAPQHTDLLQVCMRKHWLNDMQMSALAQNITTIAKYRNLSGPDHCLGATYLASYIKVFTTLDFSQPIFEKALKDNDVSLEQLEELLHIKLSQPTTDPLPQAGYVGADRSVPEEDKTTYTTAKDEIPLGAASETSLLSTWDSSLFDRLASAFTLASKTQSDVDDFRNLPIFGDFEVKGSILSLSFCARFWCGPFPATPRAEAIKMACNILTDLESLVDPQFLLPYALCALSDHSDVVRRAAIRLILALAEAYDLDGQAPSKQILGKDTLYNSQSTGSIRWLSQSDIVDFVSGALIKKLEECALDPEHVSKILNETLGKLQQAKNIDAKDKGLKSSIRASIFGFLGSHAKETPLNSVKYKLLKILKRVSKIGNVTRAQLFLPLLAIHLGEDEAAFAQSCLREQLDPKEFSALLVGIVSPSDPDGNRVLQNAISLRDEFFPHTLEDAVFQHVREVWNSMKIELQKAWADTLFRVGILRSQEKVDQQKIETARDILLNVIVPAESLLDFASQVPSLSVDIERQSPSAKRRKTKDGSVESQAEPSENGVPDKLGRVILFLELIEASKNGDNSRLMPYLFQILHDLQRCASIIGSDMSYSQSLVLSSMTRIIQYSKSPGTSPIDQQSIRVDIVIDCFRSSTSTQVQREALRFLSGLAPLAPDLIVHSIMPIFTFMGSSVLRQGDEHTARVVDSTIESIIPPLITSFRRRKGGPLGGAAELILSFAAAFEHIPNHRKLKLLTAVLEKLGEEDYLHVLLIILTDRHGEKPALKEFSANIMAQYSSVVQLKTIRNCIEVGLDSIKPEPTIVRQILGADKGKNRDAISKTLVELPLQLLKASRLSHRVAKAILKGGEEAKDIRSLYSTMVEQALRLNHAGKAFANLQEPCSSILDSLLGFLPLAESLTSLDTLLQDGVDTVRQQVLTSFEQRIGFAKLGDRASEDACFRLLPQLINLLGNTQDALLKRTTIVCIDRIADKYGKKNFEATNKAAKAILSNNCLGSTQLDIQVMSFLCLITLVEVLREAVIPLIPSILPMSLDILEQSVGKGLQKAPLQRAIFSFFSSLFLYLPWMITGNYLDRFLKLSYDSAQLDIDSSCYQVRNDTLEVLAKQASAHDSIEALQRSWDEALKRGAEPISEYFIVLGKVIERHPKSTIIKESQLLTTLFLSILDIRRSQDAIPEEVRLNIQQLERIEDTRNEIMIKMIYKMNDTHFRPLFVRMTEWATSLKNKNQRKGRIQRETSWFSFLSHFFGTLQSIVTGYATYIIDQAAGILTEYNSSQDNKSALWDRVIMTLSAMFEHDQDEFWRSPSRFTTMATPLLAQLGQAHAKNADSKLIPCITSFATAADSPDHLKFINSRILEHLHSDDAKIRFAAIRCELSLTESLGEEWLNLLPEMLPAISEAMEDDDEDVEREVRKWARKIEDVLGESLDDMLQ